MQDRLKLKNSKPKRSIGLRLGCSLMMLMSVMPSSADTANAQGNRFRPSLDSQPVSASDSNRRTVILGQDSALPPTQAGGYGIDPYTGMQQSPAYQPSAYSQPPAYGQPPAGYQQGYPANPGYGQPAAGPAGAPSYSPGAFSPFTNPTGGYASTGTAQLPGGDLGFYQSTPSVLGQGTNLADLDVYVQEGQTGKFLFGGAYNSDAGLTGQIIIDERNFDLLRWPRNLRDVIDGRAFRGGGQRFRMELVPGSQVQRYMVSLTEPYLFDSNVSLRVSGYFFNRNYFDWNEERMGGEIQLGYRLTPDLSLGVSVKGENVNINTPRVNTSAQLNNSLGDTDLYVGKVNLTHDTRDHPFLPTEGRYLEIGLSQGFGEFSFPRAELDWRRYFLLYQRPDKSGRHTVSIGSRLGFSGSNTPMFENYFAGGFSTMRGFDFRGASPVEGGVVVGGQFQWLNTVEYTFPLTADDMVKGVAFVDYGTVEQDVRLSADSFRVAPGLGLRIHMPAAGAGGAPLAFDFAVPLMRDATDDTKIFSFYLGFIR